MNEQSDTRELDREDMSELAAGNELALNRLMDRHGERILRFLSRILGDEQEAMDLTQEAFVRVYKHRHRFNPKQKFTTWLYTIGELPEELRIPVILTEYEGHSHSEIALILNCSEKAVEMRLYRARKGLRAQLANILKS